MPAKFPNRRPDGSFCVEVTLGKNVGQVEPSADQVNAWLERWAQANRIWTTSPYGPKESLDFFDEFAEIPTCVAGESGRLLLRLQGRPEATRRWKDWLVLKFLSDLRIAFEGKLAFEGAANCPDRIRERD